MIIFGIRLGTRKRLCYLIWKIRSGEFKKIAQKKQINSAVTI